jgi:hypothetical protein
MNYRLCIENPNSVKTVRVRIGWADHLVRIVVGPYRKYFWGNQTEEEKEEGKSKGDTILS